MTTNDVKDAVGTTVYRARTIASYVPKRFRGLIYSLLGAAQLLEVIWDVIPEPLDGKVQATVSALGFGLALLNTGDRSDS